MIEENTSGTCRRVASRSRSCPHSEGGKTAEGNQRKWFPLERKVGTSRVFEKGMIIDEVMTKNPTALEVQATVGDAVETFVELDVRHVPVLEGGELVGIVSDRDVRALVGQATGDEERALLARPITSIMSAGVVSCSPDDDVKDAVDAMLENRLGSVPVVREGTRELVGIVSYVDVLRVARDLL